MPLGRQKTPLFQGVRGGIMFGLGATELLIIAVIVFLIFGAKRLPQLGRSLGRVRQEFSEGKEEALQSQEQAEDGQESQPGQEEDPLTSVLKDQLVSRLPGVGRITRIKKTVERASQVAKAIDKTTKVDKTTKGD